MGCFAYNAFNVWQVFGGFLFFGGGIDVWKKDHNILVHLPDQTHLDMPRSVRMSFALNEPK